MSDYPALAFDLMDFPRPEADDALLSFVEATTFSLGDFVRQRDGECRLHPQMARTVTAATRLPQRRIDNHAKWLRELLMSEAHTPKESGVPPPKHHGR